MYQAHQTGWFIAGFLVCVGFVIVLAALGQFGRLKLPKYIFILPFGLAFLMMMAMGRLRVNDDDQLRREIRDFDPLAVSNFIVSEGNTRRQIVETNEIISFFNQLQQVQAVLADHSSYTDPVGIEFRSHGQLYRYQIGHDTQRPDEYWVFETERAGEPGREIGRIESSQLRTVLDGLLTNKP